MNERHKLLVGHSEFHPCVYMFINPLKIGNIITATFSNRYNMVKRCIYTGGKMLSRIGTSVTLFFKELFNVMPSVF